MLVPLDRHGWVEQITSRRAAAAHRGECEHPRVLRAAIASLISSVLCIGCASSQLRGSTLAVSTSIGAIIEQQVLGNLAQSYDSPYSIPAQAVLTAGAIQIENQATAAL